MSWFQGSVVSGNMPFCDPRRCQVFLDGKVRELYDSGSMIIDNGNQTRARRQHRLSWVFRAAVRLKYWTSFILEFECEKLCQLFHTERTECDHETLKKTMGIHPIFLVDVQ